MEVIIGVPNRRRVYIGKLKRGSGAYTVNFVFPVSGVFESTKVRRGLRTIDYKTTLRRTNNIEVLLNNSKY